MDNPLVSYIMPCYQQEQFIAEALESVLKQTYRPLEIVVSDDCSTDRTFDMIEQACDQYDGPHKVIVNRNRRNLGIENYNKLMEMASGQFIVQGHGDDIAFPERVGQLVDAWMNTGASVLASNAIYMQADGKKRNKHFDTLDECRTDLDMFASKGHLSYILGATLAYDRDVYDKFGRFSVKRSAITTEWVIPFRGALLQGVHILEDPLVYVRRHEKSNSDLYCWSYAPDSLPRAESIYSLYVIQHVYLLETLLQAQQLAGNRKSFKSIEVELRKNLLKWTVSWAETRNMLSHSRYRPVWNKVEAD